MHDILIAVVLLVWTVASLTKQSSNLLSAHFPQFHLFAKNVLSWDRAHLVPDWSFFAPYPVITDYHILYHDRLPDGTITPWQEVPSKRNSHNLLWNPGRRQDKKVLDHIFALLVSMQEGSVAATARRTSYSALRCLVMRQPHKRNFVSTSFIIAASTLKRKGSERTLEIVFLSEEQGS